MRKPDVETDALERLLGRVFGRTDELSYQRTPDGVSTQVYRIRRHSDTFYLRVAEEADASTGAKLEPAQCPALQRGDPVSQMPVLVRPRFAPEAELHTVLRGMGVRVPEVVRLEPFDEGLRRSVMVTSEIAGAPMVRFGEGGVVVGLDLPEPSATEEIYRAAGRDLALVNQVSVRGFDWVVRDGAAWPLRGEYPRYADWVRPAACVRMLDRIGFETVLVDRIGEVLVEQVAAGPAGPVGRLAHGDFDVTHVFHHEGRYSGIIDLGEIRGTEGWFDLAMFGLLRMPDAPASDVRLREVEERSLAALVHLEAGYDEVAPFPADYRERMRCTAVMILVHRLVRAWGRRGEPATGEAWFRRDVGWLRELLDGRGPWLAPAHPIDPR